jgi:hypothetical protein
VIRRGEPTKQGDSAAQRADASSDASAARAIFANIFSASTRKHSLEMFNGWKRVIEMMEQPSPTLIFWRLAKADRVVLDSVPLDEKQVLIRIFNTSPQLMRNISVH